MPARYVETLEVEPTDLQPYPGNAKLHDGPALLESVETNGQFRAVLARRLPDGGLQLLAGHGTTDAIKDVGGPVRVEVVEADDDEARRIVLADNALGARAGYDEQALLALLDDANAHGGFAGTGYDEDLYKELLDKVGSENPFEGPSEFKDFDEDTIDTEHECPKCGYAWSGKA